MRLHGQFHSSAEAPTGEVYDEQCIGELHHFTSERVEREGGREGRREKGIGRGRERGGSDGRREREGRRDEGRE